MGLSEVTGCPIHCPEHEVLWGLESARSDRLVLDAGECLIELVQYYQPPGRHRPAGYLISDQGILNVALRCSGRKELNDTYQRLVSNGYSANSEPWTVDGVATVVYVQDDQGLSVELLSVETSGLDEMGFVRTTSSAPPERPIHKLAQRRSQIRSRGL
jgi:hypothetical protein